MTYDGENAKPLIIILFSLCSVLKDRLEKRLKSQWLKSMAELFVLLLLPFTLQNKHVGIKRRFSVQPMWSLFSDKTQSVHVRRKLHDGYMGLHS